MPTVLIPTPLRRLTGNQSRVDVPGATAGEIIKNLEAAYPGISERLLESDGQVKRFINVFVNEDEIRTLQGADTPVAITDRVSIVPAMAGGAATLARVPVGRPSGA